MALYGKYYIFDYVTKFVREHPTIPPADKFEITDSIYNSFIAYIKGLDYSYKTKSERALEDLKNIALKENYFDAIKDEYNHLYTQMEKDKKEDLNKYSNQIKELLQMEIVTRYYYQKGKIIAALKHDPEITDAIAAIKDTEKYGGILSGKYVQPKPEIPVKNEDDEENPVE
jgi:carboxyl-terminal processing protease